MTTPIVAACSSSSSSAFGPLVAECTRTPSASSSRVKADSTSGSSSTASTAASGGAVTTSDVVTPPIHHSGHCGARSAPCHDFWSSRFVAVCCQTRLSSVCCACDWLVQRRWPTPSAAKPREGYRYAPAPRRLRSPPRGADGCALAGHRSGYGPAAGDSPLLVRRRAPPRRGTGCRCGHHPRCLLLRAAAVYRLQCPHRRHGGAVR